MIIQNVPLIPQTSSMSCWAASIAMILGWRNRASIDPTTVAANVGGTNYMPQFANGLSPSDTYILRRRGFEVEPLRSPSVRRWQALVAQYGPLWVATAAPFPHVRVVCGVTEDAVYVNDPAPVNSGSQYRQAVTALFGQMDNLARTELPKESAPIYVAYLRS